MIDLSNLDYTDSKDLFAFAVESVFIAEEYKKARIEYSQAKRSLNKMLAESYNSGTVDKKISHEKALLILCNQRSEAEACLDTSESKEAEFKGLEKVLDVRQGVVSLAQSLCKFQNQHQ